MSAGVFTNAKYASSDTGLVHPIRVQPETITATVGVVPNSQPAGAIDTGISAQVSASARSLGLHARRVYAKIAGTTPTGYSGTSKISIPCLTETFYAACSKGVTLSYLGTTWTVTGRRAEVTR